MRVLVITDWAPIEGGTERYVAEVVEGLRGHGDDVCFLTSSAGSRGRERADFVAYGSRSRAGRAVTQLINPAAAATVRRAVRAFRPDVAHLHMFVSFLAPGVVQALGSVPVVVTLCDYRPICPIGLHQLPDGSPCPHRPGLICGREGCVSSLRLMREGPRYALIAHALERAARIITISRWMQRRIAAAGLASQPIPLPVRAPNRPRSLRAPMPAFVYGGRLDPEKGIEDLLAAFRRVRRRYPGARLDVFGDGALRARVEAVAAESGSGVSLLPGMREDWWRYVSGAWAVVVPSSWEEPFGLVAVEAIVRGLPVIASNSGGLRDTVVEGKTGLLYPRGDVGQLADRMAAVASGDIFAHQLPEEDVGELVARHDPDRHIGRLRAVLAEAMTA